MSTSKIQNSYKAKINLNYDSKIITVPRFLCFFRHLNSWFNHHRMLSKENPDIMSIFFGNSKWDSDIQLSNIGKMQGVQLTEYWHYNMNTSVYYQKFIASSYKRAQDSMKFITPNFQSNKSIIEKHAGQYYGYSQAQLLNCFPNYTELKKDRWGLKLGPENGKPEDFTESYSEVIERLYSFLYYIGNANTAICTHGEVLTAIRYIFEAPEVVKFNDFIVDTIGSNYSQNGEMIEYDFELRLTRTHRLLKDEHNLSNYYPTDWRPF